ncbi:hypothetical protein LNTAR_14597 [Lentisphaera araneosa HTCC2155]|uniref:Uncharacterized protein n=1 Tax=Lentisphaera araneosa HTCC2155 TaxID=313628 RepID=A6DHH1_9BACT|nr:hypothetical protein [Lentisphaera araneosa]EDM29054.1 hypothetical protein LNTAR_14597 [Lentisphaera araneosa HTCC2155]
MKKLLNLKEKNSGIAIMFSLMMMAVFLVLGMGFSAYMSNIRRAAEYQKDFKVNKDIEDVLIYQIRLALKGGFDVEGEYSGAASDYYAASMPEGAPSKFYGASTINDSSDSTLQKPDTTTDIHYAAWGIESTDPLHYVKADEILFTVYDANADNIDAASYIDPDVFTSPNDPTNGALGWQEHIDENNQVYAISTWALIGMSGRLDPSHVDTATSGTSLTALKANGENISEVSVSNFITNGLARAAVSLNSTSALPTFQDALRDADSGSFDDSAYFSFFPLASKYTFEMLNESDVLEKTDKSLTMHSTESPITLFDLSEIYTDNTITPEVIAGNSGSKPIIYLSDATSTVPETQRLQIAANLIDYIDADDTPSTDYDGSNRATLTYMGNEKVPVINELQFDLSFSWSHSSGEITHTFTADVVTELLNMYTISPSITGGTITFTADISYTLWDGWKGNHKDVSTATHTFTIDTSGNSFSTPSYINTTSSSISPSLDQSYFYTDINAIYTQVKNFTISNISPITFTGSTGDTWDVAQIDNGSGEYTQATINTAPRYLAFQCAEPKLNHDPNQWSTTTGATTFATLATNTMTGPSFINTTYIPSGNMDREDATDPKDLSTNYIRNNVILNLHELGYIHRGVPYQTLNLIEFNTETPEKIGNYTNSNGEFLYNSAKTFESLSNGGDRSILDYVSVGTNSTTGDLEETTPNQGRINPNTNHPSVLKALFYGISADHPGSNTDRVGVSGTTILDSDIMQLISQFPGINSSRTNLPYHGGGDDFPSIGYFDPLWFKNLKNNPPSYGIPFKKATNLNDREAEVLLCNTRRFVSVNRNYYIASLAVDATSTSADDGTRATGIPCTQQYLLRELIDDAKDSSDSSATPHDPSDDRYRVRILR